MQEDKTLMHYVAQVRYILQVVGPIATRASFLLPSAKVLERCAPRFSCSRGTTNPPRPTEAPRTTSARARPRR